MGYRVIRTFTDLHDGNHRYLVGDSYPHSGAGKVSDRRIAELASDKNRQGTPLIKEDEEEISTLNVLDTEEEVSAPDVLNTEEEISEIIKSKDTPATKSAKKKK